MQGDSSSWLILLAIAAAGAMLWPGVGFLAQARRRREIRGRVRLEDALTHIPAWQQRAQNATPESLAGALNLPQRRVLRLITRMEQRSLVQSVGGALRLTAEGERWAVHVVRAHRLWERYLSDDAGMPISRLHQLAEKAEHGLTVETLDELDAHLGHPRHDPHGDPIPGADGSLAPLQGISLADWPSAEAARIVHIEDEPDVIFQQILAAGLRPGITVRILEKHPDRLVISDGRDEHRLAPVVAANIQVAAAEIETRRPGNSKRLSELREGEAAEVVELDAHCRGFSRRRLLDLGLTPNARVEVALENTFGDPRAYRVRGSMIALRRQQTDHVWVKPFDAGAKISGGASPKAASPT